MGTSASKPVCPSDTNSQNATIADFVIVGICMLYELLNIYLLVFHNHNNTLVNLASLNLLSALLASGTAVLFTFTKWPQPLTDAGLLTMLFALISLLGWNKYILRQPGKQHNKTMRERLIKASEKIPDVAALAVTSFTLWVVQSDYTERTGNTFQTKHAPLTYAICAAVVVGVGSLLGCLAIARGNDSNNNNWYTIILLLFDVLVGLGFGSYAIYMVVADQFCGLYLAAGVLIGCALLMGATVAIAASVYLLTRPPRDDENTYEI